MKLTILCHKLHLLAFNQSIKCHIDDRQASIVSLHYFQHHMIILLSVDWIIIIIKNEWDKTDNHVDVDKEDARHDDNGGDWNDDDDMINMNIIISMMIMIMIVITNESFHDDVRHDDNGGGWSGEWYDNYDHDLNKSMMIIIMIVITNKN